MGGFHEQGRGRFDIPNSLDHGQQSLYVADPPGGGGGGSRILGPEGYGQIQYAVALSGMLMPLCTLGLRDVLVPELVRCPRNGGAVVGSAVVMRLVASLGAVGLCALGTWLDSPAQGNAAVVLLYSISLIPAALEPLGDWFRAELRTAVPAVAACVAAAGAGLCQVGLLRAGMGAGWFALAHSLEALGAGLLLAYRRGPHRRLLRWDGERGRALFQKSRHYIFSGFLVALYGRVDRLILQKMLGQEAVGLYAVAASVSTMWTLVPAALVEAARPAILSRRDRSPDDFRQGLAGCTALSGTAPAWLQRAFAFCPGLCCCFCTAKLIYRPGPLCVSAPGARLSLIWGRPGVSFWQRTTTTGMKNMWRASG